MGWSPRDLPRLSHPKAAAIELKCTSALATAENAGIVHTHFPGRRKRQKNKRDGRVLS